MIRTTVPLAIAFLLVGCGENPTALDDLNPEVEFEIEAARVETFTATEIHVRATESGMPMRMQDAYLEIRHKDEEDVRRVPLEQHEDGYEAHAYFYEEGEHHVHMVGMLEGHTIMAEFGEHEVHANLQRQFIGPYWVELSIPGGPVLEDSTAHVHAMVYDMLPDGSRGNPVAGLEVHMAIHSPDGSEMELTVAEEEAGEYEAEYSFGHAGGYELHVEIEVNTFHEDGEFHVPVQTSDELDGGHVDGGDGGDDGHGH